MWLKYSIFLFLPPSIPSFSSSSPYLSPSLFPFLPPSLSLSLPLFPTRETLLGQLTNYIHSLRDNFVTLTSAQTQAPLPRQQSHRDLTQIASEEKLAPPTGKNLPPVVNHIIWTRQLEARVSLELLQFY